MSEQAAPTPGHQSVTRALIALIEERERKGIATYGTTLQTFNGRDATRDLLEELVDAAQYALQWQMERRELLGQVERLRAALGLFTDPHNSFGYVGTDANLFCWFCRAGLDRKGNFDHAATCPIVVARTALGEQGK